MWTLKILRRIVGVKNLAAIIATKRLKRQMAKVTKKRKLVPAHLHPCRDLAQNSGNGCCVHSKAAALRVILASPFRTERIGPVLAIVGFRRVA
jgi:hypothetical protein